MNKLYFGDNLDVLREYVADESADLIYLDPPFNSQAQYNILFHSPDDETASAQVEAFRDTWAWGNEATLAFAEIMRSGGDVARFIDALRSALKESNMMAYLVMMAVRLRELRRVLKPTGSLYLHCDTTASHYLKIMLDQIFGPNQFQNEVTWRRTSAHNDPQRYGRIQDRILFYSKGKKKTFNHVGGTYSDEQLARYKYEEGERRYKGENLTAPHFSSTRTVEWRGVHPGADRQWRFSTQELERLWDAGLILPRRDGTPRKDGLKEYLDENESPALQDLWTDINRIGNTASERLGYPTQKPVALLDRIIRSSSNEGDVILDPFCGCGTTVEAAERALRPWIGIDVAVHAIKVIEARLGSRFDETVKFDIEGMPRDFASAVKLAERDKYQFQWWANYLFNPHALREQKKGADRGIDGELFFPNGPGRPWGRMLTSVKGGEHVSPNDVRAFAQVLTREGAQLGLFICLRSPTREMMRDAAAVGLADIVHGDMPKLQIVAIEDWFKGKMPLLPPLEHLPSAAFGGRRRPAGGRTPRPDVVQPELPFSFVGGKEVKGVVRHFNPRMVEGVA